MSKFDATEADEDTDVTAWCDDGEGTSWLESDDDTVEEVVVELKESNKLSIV
jgi:hypothetical protein